MDHIAHHGATTRQVRASAAVDITRVFITTQANACMLAILACADVLASLSRKRWLLSRLRRRAQGKLASPLLIVSEQLA